MSGNFLELATKRRSIYVLGNDLPLSKDDVAALIKEAVRQAPSSFNSQSSRVVVLFGEEHKKLWEITREQLRKIVPAENFQGTSDKMDMFAASAGSVLFFEDETVIAGLQEQFPSYADNFPVWSEHSSAIAQFATWTALAEKNIGASLQHYNPIIDEEVAQTFEIPSHWKLRAQLVFGSIEAPAGEKTFMDDAERFKTFA